MKKLISGCGCALLALWVCGCATQPLQHRSFQKTEKQTTITTQYLIYLPEDYREYSEEKWPLLIFLHGADECGEDIEKVKAQGIPRLIAEGQPFPWIVVSPQCPADKWWDIELLMDLLKTVEHDYRVDADRIYLTGIGMGAMGTWRWAETHPEIFAALVPVGGEGDPRNVYRFRHIPVWVFQGNRDKAVTWEKARAMVEALKKCQADVSFTVYPNDGPASGERAYAEQELYVWLAEKKRNPIEVPVAKKYPPLEARRTLAEIAVDGDLSEWQQRPGLRLETADRSQGMRRIKLKWLADKNAKSTYRGPQDCSAEIKVMWSEEGLYFAAEVADDKVVCVRTGDPIWIGDCIDVGLSFGGENDRRRPYVRPLDFNQAGQEDFTNQDFIFGFAPSGPNQTPEYHIYRNPLWQNIQSNDGVQVAARITLKGYTLEAFVSARLLGCEEQLKYNAQWRFNCGVYDLDEPAKAEDFAVSEWPSSAGDPWSPDTFGVLTLK